MSPVVSHAPGRARTDDPPPGKVRKNRYARRSIRLALTFWALFPATLMAQTIDLGNGLFLDNGEISDDVLMASAAASSRHFCLINVGNPGTLAAAIGNVALSSKVAGGYSGSAQILTTNGSYTIAVDQPVAFVNSPPLGGAVTFLAEFSASGATNFGSVTAPSVMKLKRGSTDISADLTATIEGASFAAGQYQAEIVLRCE